MATKEQIKAAQEHLGCPGCLYADTKALFETPCCTFAGLIHTDYDTGICLTRKDKPALKELSSIETNEYSLNVYQCKCGFHIGLDVSYLEQVGDIVLNCPSCKELIQIIEF